MDEKKPREQDKPVDLFEEYALDLTAEVDGRWFKDWRKGLDLRIARANTPAWTKTYGRLLQELRADGDDSEITREQSEELLIRCMSDCVLVGWRPVLRFRGEDLAYSAANAYKVLADPQMREFRDQVWRVANRVENWYVRNMERDAKN